MKKTIGLVMTGMLVFSCVYQPVCGRVPAASARTAKIVMNRSKISLTQGGTFRLKVKKVRPARIGKSVTYRSRQKKIASVNKRGVVKAKKAGTAKITVTLKKNKKIRTTVKVKVTNQTNSGSSNASRDTGGKTADRGQGNAGSALPPSKQDKDTEEYSPLLKMYLDIITSRFSLQLDSVAGQIALDLSECGNLSEADRYTMQRAISGKYGKETILKTWDELKQEGRIVEDETYGYVLNGAALLTIRVTGETPDGFTFDIDCRLNGLNVAGFTGCKAVCQDQEWKYELGGSLMA